MRTRVRRLRPDDFENMRLLESSPEIMRYTSMRVPLSEEQTRKRLAASIVNPDVWAADLSDGTFVGWFMLRPVAGDDALWSRAGVDAGVGPAGGGAAVGSASAGGSAGRPASVDGAGRVSASASGAASVGARGSAECAADRGASPGVGSCFELGFMIVPALHGQGLTTEIAGHLVSLAKQQDPSTRIVACTTSDNVASMRVLAKLGFKSLPSDDNSMRLFELV